MSWRAEDSFSPGAAVSASVAMLVMALGLGACADTTGIDAERVSLTTDRTTYRLDDTLVITLTNRSLDVIRFAWCMVGRQRREDGGWAYLRGPDLTDWVEQGKIWLRITGSPGAECETGALPPRTATDDEIVLSPSYVGWEAGSEYRFVIAIWGKAFSSDDPRDRAAVFSNVWAIVP